MWGDSSFEENIGLVKNQLSSGVKEIFSNIYPSGHSYKYSFAALKEDGSVVTWGDGELGI